MFLFVYFWTEATPKSLMRVMGISGLTLYHLKSHLQAITLHFIIMISIFFSITKQERKQALTVYSSSRNIGWGKANRQKPALAINQMVRLRIHCLQHLNSYIEFYNNIIFFIFPFHYCDTDYREIQSSNGNFSSDTSDGTHKKMNE